ncbi:MAG: hypothetical protein AAF984_02085 [Verrucomicrobiota bacterium]
MKELFFGKLFGKPASQSGTNEINEPAKFEWRVYKHNGTRSGQWKEVYASQEQEDALMEYERLRSQLDEGGLRVEFDETVFSSVWIPERILENQAALSA